MLDLKFRSEVPKADQVNALALADMIDQRNLSDSTITGYTSYGARKVGEVEGSPVIEVIGVSEGVKRDGSVVRVPGIDLSNIKANPVFMWAHNYGMPPIGRIEKFARGTVKGIGKVVRITVAPLKSQMDSEHKRFADAIFDMFLEGDLRTVSMGWRTLDAEIMRDKDGFFQGFDFKKTDALEFSAAPIPADPDALVTKIKQRGLDPEKIMDHFVTQKGKSVYVLRDTLPENFDIDKVEMSTDDFTTINYEDEDGKSEVKINFDVDVIRALMDTNTELLATVKELRQLIEDTDSRIGAALNSKNKGLLANAVTAISTVLEAAGGTAAFVPFKKKDDEDEDEKDKKKKKKKPGEKDDEKEQERAEDEGDDDDGKKKKLPPFLKKKKKGDDDDEDEDGKKKKKPPFLKKKDDDDDDKETASSDGKKKKKRLYSYEDIGKLRDDLKTRLTVRRETRIQTNVLGELAAGLRASKTHSKDKA